MTSKWRPKLLPAIILAAAAALRFWGLKWGLPNSAHAYSYHPDEFLTIGAAGIVLCSFFPRFYNYPSLYIYLAAVAMAFGSVYGLAPDLAGAYLCARVVTALMGIGAVAVVYWAGNKLWGSAPEDSPGFEIPDYLPGLLAGLVLCIAPLHVQHSHFATVDVPSTLFVAACLGFAGLVLKRGWWRDYLLCGVMAGLAAGTKYNAGLVVLSLITAHYLGGKGRFAGLSSCRWGRSSTLELDNLVLFGLRLIAALGCVIAAFIISTPGIIFQWSNFKDGFLYEVAHSAAGHGLVFAGTGNGFVYTFTSSLWYGLGPALAILFVIAAVYVLAKRDRSALIILAFALPYYALISISQVRFARYALPLFPAAALLIGWMARDVWSRLPKGIKWAWAGLCAVVLVGTLLYTIALDRLFVQPPPQDRAARWIFANIPKGSTIGVIDLPWFYSPPYSSSVSLDTEDLRIEALRHFPYALAPIAEPPFPMISWPRRHWCIVSDYEISEAARLRENRSVSDADRAQAQRVIRDLNTLKVAYTLRATFSDRLCAFGISFGSTESLPHDMRYPAPTIWIYELKKP